MIDAIVNRSLPMNTGAEKDTILIDLMPRIYNDNKVGMVQYVIVEPLDGDNPFYPVSGQEMIEIKNANGEPTLALYPLDCDNPEAQKVRYYRLVDDGSKSTHAVAVEVEIGDEFEKTDFSSAVLETSVIRWYGIGYLPVYESAKCMVSINGIVYQAIYAKDSFVIEDVPTCDSESELSALQIDGWAYAPVSPFNLHAIERLHKVRKA